MTTATLLVWFNQFTDSDPPTHRKSYVIIITHILKFVNYHSYKERDPTPTQSGEAIKIVTQLSYVIEIVLKDKKIYKDIRQSRLCSTRLEASSGARTEEIPTSTQRRRGSGPCVLWVCLDKTRRLVPTALLVTVLLMF